MTRSEFVSWMEDICRKSPSLGEWLKKLPKATHDDWFEHVFKNIDQRWATAVNLEIMTGQHDLTGYNRDRLCAVFIRRCAELKQASAESEQQTRSSGANRILLADPITGPMYRYVQAKMRAYKQDSGVDETPRQMIKQWTDEAPEKFDHTVDDPENQPRYRCIKCCDTGVMTDQVRPDTVGTCDCEAGKKRETCAYRSGRKLGPALQRVAAFDDWNLQD